MSELCLNRDQWDELSMHVLDLVSEVNEAVYEPHKGQEVAHTLTQILASITAARWPEAKVRVAWSVDDHCCYVIALNISGQYFIKHLHELITERELRKG